METQHSVPAYPSGVFVAEIDGDKARSFRGFYSRIASVLYFPDYFGKNLDALFDCLCSLEAMNSKEVVLQIRHWENFLSREKPEKKQAALDVLRAAELPENRYDGTVFRVVIMEE